jgi:hypothetical protein
MGLDSIVQVAGSVAPAEIKPPDETPPPPQANPLPGPRQHSRADEPEYRAAVTGWSPVESRGQDLRLSYWLYRSREPASSGSSYACGSVANGQTRVTRRSGVPSGPYFGSAGAPA